MNQRLRILFAGSGEFGLPSLQQLRQAGHEVVAVYTQPDRPAGRGRREVPTPIAQYGLAERLAVVRTADINAESLPPADLLIVIAFGQKISPQVTAHARLGSINLHASRLPRLRGAAPINWAIVRGERVTGNSVIRLAPRMDAGAVLAQSLLEIGETETAGELHDRLALDGAPLVLQVAEALAAGTAVEQEQDHAQATIAPKITRESTRIDWCAQSAEAIACTIRGFYPWPGCRVSLRDPSDREVARLTLARARASAGDAEGMPPGQLTRSGHIATSAGAVQVLEVQPEGRGRMPLAAYRNGHPWQPGWRVESVL
jgi:methionyl-tRNA formyltransferase